LLLDYRCAAEPAAAGQLRKLLQQVLDQSLASLTSLIEKIENE
jgi:hypothetical protein